MNQDDNNDIDDHVDAEILTCLDFKKPKSFFLFAGAGSGKTRSLVNVLKDVQKNHKDKLILNNQRVAIITYTNAACDEITDRLDYDSLFEISTIHSFIWKLIKYHTIDIKEWLGSKLNEDINDLEEKQSKVKKITKTSIDRVKKIESKKKRLEYLKYIREFIYNPNGDNLTKDSLNHSEVIGIGASFLSNKVLMQRILVQKFPILLIDESQDTNKELIDSFFAVQKLHKDYFSLGLFGDMMQRIYFDGKPTLGNDGSIPDDWDTPRKQMNHRCPKRVIRLINKIRKDVDKEEQIPRSDKPEGFARLFLVNNACIDKMNAEKDITLRMSEITKDNKWNGDEMDVKVLTLEHHMAAKRMGFSDFFEPLYNIGKLKEGILNGSLSSINFFTNTILPLYKANCDNDKFEIARIVKEKSDFIRKENLITAGNQISLIKDANKAVVDLFNLWDGGRTPKLIDILRNIAKTKLFPIPDSLLPIAIRTDKELSLIEQESESSEVEKNEIIEAWDKALLVPFNQIELYQSYIADEANFGTHQGVKGLEFPRVMVILDDVDARGNWFNFEKIVGVKPPSPSDIKNEGEGKETGIDRTLRLFYVTCSRAQESLAIVAYTSNPELFKKNVVDNGWFEKEEIEIINE